MLPVFASPYSHPSTLIFLSRTSHPPRPFLICSNVLTDELTHPSYDLTTFNNGCRSCCPRSLPDLRRDGPPYFRTSHSLSYCRSSSHYDSSQASVSAPTWEDVSFLNVDLSGQTTRFGVFGFTGSDTNVGWFFPSNLGYVPYSAHNEYQLTYVSHLQRLATKRRPLPQPYLRTSSHPRRYAHFIFDDVFVGADDP